MKVPLSGAGDSHQLRAREESSAEALLLDTCGLFFVVVVGSFMVAPAVKQSLFHFLPSARGSIELPAVGAFSLGFVGLDYVAYWTHRLFHHRALWRFHVVHHTLVRMHPIGAFRHSLGECLLSLVFWLHAAIAWLLADPMYYLIAISTGFVLDIWRHSTVETTPRGSIGRLLRATLVTPEDHAMHHRHPEVTANYGANLKVWDRLHRTHCAPDRRHAAYGTANDDGSLRLMFWAARTRSQDA
jgi:sterol desaturase/sphingolipid hydroxylase (fatty acid hydroxylase superfamily)